MSPQHLTPCAQRQECLQVLSHCRQEACFPLATLAERYSDGPEADSLLSKARGRRGSTSASGLRTDRKRVGLIPSGTVGRWDTEQKELPGELKNEKGKGRVVQCQHFGTGWGFYCSHCLSNSWDLAMEELILPFLLDV